MKRTNYFVSVGTRSVQTDIPDAGYLEVLATDEELDRLQELLRRSETLDEHTHLTAPIPYKSNDHASAGQEYNDNLVGLYAYIYTIGTEETKRHIERMNILEKLQDTDYNLPGYRR